MQNTQVKSHKRKGRVVKSHSRAVKGAKTYGAGMSAEECKAKYDVMVAKYGENSPQAKKLAMKMEGMETVEKDARKMSAEDRRTLKQANSKGQKEKDAVMKNSGRYAMKKKHSRGDYMRKNVEEDLLTKNARKKVGAKKVSTFEKADYGRMMKMATSKDPKERKAYKDEVAKNRASSTKGKDSIHDKMAKLRAMKKK